MSDTKSPEPSMGEILATIRRIIAEDEQSASTAAPGGTPGNNAEKPAGEPEEVLELTNAVTEDGSVRPLAPLGGSSRTGPERREPPPVAETASERPVDPAPVDAPEAPTAAEPLLCEPAVSAAAAAFAGLSEVPREPPATPDVAMVGGRPLEDSVRELLRPLLRNWLDDNLPEIVERLVKAEIARVRARSAVD